MRKAIFATLLVVMLCAGLGCGVTPVSPDAGPSIWTDAGPSIWTDKADYDPGEVVTVYGAGFSPGPVTLTVTRPDGETDQIPDASADSSGSFAASYPLDGIIGTYIVNATDSVGQTAQTTFTDGATEVSVGGQVGTLTYGTAGSVTYTITVWGSGEADVSLSISGLPAGISATFDPNPIQGETGQWPAKTSTLTISTTDTTPAGTYAFTVHAGGHDASGTVTITAVCITYYKDADGDSYGVTNDSKCLYAPEGDYSATQGGDCDDTDAAVNPGVTEVCNDIDDDCDGLTDEEGATGCTTYYKDSDDDSYGVTGDSKCLCAPEGDYTATVGGDYDDTDAAVNPGATEIWYDGVDQDCDGANDYDADGDTYVATGYEAQAGGTAPNTGDCDDTDASVNPGATEIWYDGTDQDCDGANDYDADGDTYVATGYEAQAGGTALNTGDCDDTDADVNPGATEVCNGIDDDCDGNIDEGVTTTYYQDKDGDTYGNSAVSQQACSQPTGYVLDNTDCDDNDANEHPGQTWYKDADDDGYSDGTTDTTSCTRPPGYKLASELTATSGDNDDSDAGVNPGVIEVPYNGKDDDHNPATPDDDLDQDGYPIASDCDDNDANVNPGASEVPYNGKDDDCDPATLDEKVLAPSASGGGTTTPGGGGDTTIPSPAGGRSSSAVSRCFIATAAYGTSTAEQIDLLREFRDVVLLESTVGSRFVGLYYRLSPPIADVIAGNELLRTLVRELLVDPIVWVVEATGDIWRN